MREALSNRLSEELLARYQMALTQIDFLLKVEQSDIPVTMNHYFNDNVMAQPHYTAYVQAREHDTVCSHRTEQARWEQDRKSREVISVTSPWQQRALG